jgi:hypothetical protein
MVFSLFNWEPVQCGTDAEKFSQADTPGEKPYPRFAFHQTPVIKKDANMVVFGE